VVKTKKPHHPLILEMPHEGLAATIEMDEPSAVLKEIVLTCINITQGFVQLLNRAKGFKERYSWLLLRSRFIDTLILLEFFNIVYI
jgi:hypothetical protein